VFFLDDADRELVEKRRGEHNRLGFALQLTTARRLGVFLPDPTDVPETVLSYVAGQLEIGEPSCVGRYLERRPTRFDHAEEIKRACGLRDFAQARGEFEEWLWARAWMTGDGPRAMFADAIGWLRERDVLLPGVTTLARLVARARADGDERLWETLAGAPTVEQRGCWRGCWTSRRGPGSLILSGGARVPAIRRARAFACRCGVSRRFTSWVSTRGGCGHWCLLGDSSSWPDTGWRRRRPGCAGIPGRVVWRRCWRRLTTSRRSTTASRRRAATFASGLMPYRRPVIGPSPWRRRCRRISGPGGHCHSTVALHEPDAKQRQQRQGRRGGRGGPRPLAHCARSKRPAVHDSDGCFHEHPALSRFSVTLATRLLPAERGHQLRPASSSASCWCNAAL
jgi:hypothetical protein